MKIIHFRSLALACAAAGSLAAGMFAAHAQAQTATVTGRVTNASGQPELINKPGGGCTLRPDGSCVKAQATVREVNDPPACLSAGATPDQARAIVTSRSNIKRPGVAAEATEAPPGPPGAPINTTRSNIKRPGVAAEVTEAPAGPPGAPVITSRSNKKAGVAIGATGALPGPPGAPISTTRSNIKRPGVAAEATEAPAGPPGAPVNTSRSNKKAGIASVCEAEEAMGAVSTTR